MPDASPLIAAIDEAYAREQQQKPREYIGASVVGHPCDAYLAFSLRGFPEDVPPPRLKRVFRLGHILEDEVVRDLKRSGLRVSEKDQLTGKQYGYDDFGGHISAHADGHVEMEDGELRLLEVKSMNRSSFSKFAEDGVRRSHPRYYAQMQMLMGMSGIPSCLFIAYGKDTSEYHAEIVEYDEFEWSALKARIETALRGEAKKVATDRSDWRCKGCFRASVCWLGAEVPKRCGTCAHARPDPKTWWWCGKHERAAEATCADWTAYEPLPRTT